MGLKHLTVFNRIKNGCSTEDIKKMLSNNNIDVNYKSEETKNTSIFEFVLESYMVLYQYWISDGIEKAKKEKLAFIKQLISMGADIGKEEFFQGQSPLEKLCRTESIDTEIIELLIKSGANVNCISKSSLVGCGGTAMASVPLDRKDIAKLLIDNGVDLNLSESGNTPIINVLLGREYPEEVKLDYLQFLIDNGADVNAVDANGCTPLCFVKDIAMAKCLVDNGAILDKEIPPKNIVKTINVRTDKEKNIINFLIKTESTPAEVIAYLIERCKPDLNIQNEQGETPLLLWAKHSHDADKIEVLLKAGADPNIQDTNGDTVITLLLRYLISLEDTEKILPVLLDYNADLTLKNKFNDDFQSLLNNREFTTARAYEAFKTKDTADMLQSIKNIKQIIKNHNLQKQVNKHSAENEVTFSI